MTYGKDLIDALRNRKIEPAVGDPRDPGATFHLLQHEADDLRFMVRYQTVESLGLTLDYLAVRRVRDPRPQAGEINALLERQADAVKERITFLLEEFRLIELDRQNKRAQLRSYPPFARDDSRFYFEIVLDEGVMAHLQRYQFNRSARRYQKVTSQLTLETFERLVDEMVGILRQD